MALRLPNVICQTRRPLPRNPPKSRCHSVDKLYWNMISGSPFYQVAQPWMKDYVYQAEFNVLYRKVDK